MGFVLLSLLIAVFKLNQLLVSALQKGRVLLVLRHFISHTVFSPIPPSYWVAAAILVVLGSCSWAKFTKELWNGFQSLMNVNSVSLSKSWFVSCTVSHFGTLWLSECLWITPKLPSLGHYVFSLCIICPIFSASAAIIILFPCAHLLPPSFSNSFSKNSKTSCNVGSY